MADNGGNQMRTAFHATRFALTVGAFSAALISASGYAADLNEVRITFDKDVAARTNMQREPGDSSVLGVTFDQDIAKRTNMQREASDVGTVNVSPDMAIRERTNMGGIARQAPEPAAPATAEAPRR
jgi:hypothetical protein